MPPIKIYDPLAFTLPYAGNPTTPNTENSITNDSYIGNIIENTNNSYLNDSLNESSENVNTSNNNSNLLINTSRNIRKSVSNWIVTPVTEVMNEVVEQTRQGSLNIMGSNNDSNNINISDDSSDNDSFENIKKVKNVKIKRRNHIKY